MCVHMYVCVYRNMLIFLRTLFPEHLYLKQIVASSLFTCQTSFPQENSVICCTFGKHANLQKKQSQFSCLLICLVCKHSLMKKGSIRSSKVLVLERFRVSWNFSTCSVLHPRRSPNAARPLWSGGARAGNLSRSRFLIFLYFLCLAYKYHTDKLILYFLPYLRYQVGMLLFCIEMESHDLFC